VGSQAVAFLLQCGADPNAATAREHLGVPAGSTPLSVARAKKVVALLKAATRKR